MDSKNFGAGKILGLFFTLPFVLFLFFAFLYIPSNLYMTSNRLLKDHNINPWSELQKEIWHSNKTQTKESERTFGLIKDIAKSSAITSLKAMLIILLPAFVFSFILLYMVPAWIRSIMMMFRNFFYLMPTILLAYLGYFYLIPLITDHVPSFSWLSNPAVLSLFVFPYSVIAFTYGLEKIWPSINTINPTFAGRVVKKNFSFGKIIALIFVIIFVAILTFTKVFGETVIFSTIIKDNSLSNPNISSSIINSINIAESGIILNDTLSIGIILFMAMSLFLVTLISNIISNIGLAIIGSIFNKEVRSFRTKFSNLALSIPKIIFSLAILGVIGLTAYFMVNNIPNFNDTSVLSENFPDLSENISTFEITAPSVFYFSLYFVGYSLLIGIPVGLFLGYVVKDSAMEHLIFAIVRIFDQVPVITIGLFGFSFFILDSVGNSLNIMSAGLTTALFLAPKVAIITYEIIASGRTAFLAVKEERPYITSGSYIISGIIKIIGTAIQIFGLMGGVVITVLYTGSTLFGNDIAPDFTTPLISYSQQMFTIMSNNKENLDTIKPILDNYYIKIMWNYILFFLIGGGLKFIMSLVDSIRLRGFHKKLD